MDKMVNCKLQGGLRDNCGVKVMERSFEHNITMNIPLMHENCHSSMNSSSNDDDIFLIQRNYKTDTESDRVRYVKLCIR